MRSPSRQQPQQLKQVRFEDENANGMQDDGQEEQHAHDTVYSNLTSNIFQPQLEQPVTSTSQRTPFQFQQRAQQSTSTAQLSAALTNARSNRRSGLLFLDRQRRTRRDARDQRGIETFEQIDYMHEKRKRETYFEREAQRIDMDVDLDDSDVLDAQTAEVEDMSPTEDKEVEELVQGYYDYTDIDHESSVDLVDDFDFEHDEEVFMELLSQEDNKGVVMGMGSLTHDPSVSDRQDGGGHGGGTREDGDMEMS